MEMVAVVGDVHGDIGFLNAAKEYAHANNCTTIVQVGDFGLFWPGENWYMQTVRDLFADSGMKLMVLDGNHENFDALETHGFYDPDGDQDEPVQIYKNVYYLPRGCVFQLGNTTCMAFGGAYSIDKWNRKAHISWWEQEIPEMGQVYRALERGERLGPIHTMFSHDAPSAADIPGLHSAKKIVAKQTLWVEACLQRLLEDLNPVRWFHGHHHQDYQQRINRDSCTIHGLHCNFSYHDFGTLNKAIKIAAF